MTAHLKRCTSRLCATCGGFWPDVDDGELCCGDPKLDCSTVHAAYYDGATLVTQRDEAIR